MPDAHVKAELFVGFLDALGDQRTYALGVVRMGLRHDIVTPI